MMLLSSSCLADFGDAVHDRTLKTLETAQQVNQLMLGTDWISFDDQRNT